MYGLCWGRVGAHKLLQPLWSRILWCSELQEKEWTEGVQAVPDKWCAAAGADQPCQRAHSSFSLSFFTPLIPTPPPFHTPPPFRTPTRSNSV